jgi:ketosteroid isomerase-like protein
MSQENVEIVRRGFEAFQQNDFEAWFALASSEITLYPRPEEPCVKASYGGKEGIVDYLVNWYSGWMAYTAEATRFIDAGESVIVDVREVGTAEQSGMRVEENFAHAFKVVDGLIVEWRMFGPLSEALNALGPRE